MIDWEAQYKTLGNAHKDLRKLCDGFQALAAKRHIHIIELTAELELARLRKQCEAQTEAVINKLHTALDAASTRISKEVNYRLDSKSRE